MRIAPTTRRDILKAAALTPAVGIAACSTADTAEPARFSHGVASGDPLADRVVLWTRAVPARGDGDVALRWEVAEAADFAQPVAEGSAVARARADFTAKVDAAGLAPGRRYFYRFWAGDTPSPVGRTKTLPAGRVDETRIAAVSCSHFSWGYFNVYRALARRDDVDAVLHLGDYIYEYPNGTYPSAEQIVASRLVAPANELFTLADYRTRYALYRSDGDLAALHAAQPVIAVWDDHEFANDAWKGGAENHGADEGDWLARRAAALQAWREWMPVRETAAVAAGEIYRRFDFGDLARLVMLDTRTLGRAQQLSFERDLRLDPDASGDRQVEAVTAFRRDFLDRAERELLGAKQARWLHREIADSARRGQLWQVLGQQVVLGKLSIPPNAASFVPRDDAAASVRRRIAQLAGLAAFGLPLNLDAWDGYPAARRRLLDHALEHAGNTITLAGDSHNAWAFELEHEGQIAAVEFAAPSVTSPGIERFLKADPARMSRAFRQANDELKWTDLSNRGFVLLTLGRDEARAEFWFADTVTARSDEMRLGQAFSVAASPGAGVAPLVKV